MVDIGNAQIIGEREKQEDYFATLPDAHGILGIVADGMGGHVGGEIASAVCVKAFTHHFRAGGGGDALLPSLYRAHAALEKRIETEPSLKEMGTTLVAAWIDAQQIRWISVGDSLLYRCRNGVLTRLNADHSLGAELVASGELTPDEAALAPGAQMLTSAVMAGEIMRIDLPAPEPVQAGDIFLIASDGIQTLREAVMADLLSAYATDMQKAAQMLIDAVTARTRRRQDNATVITIRVN